MLANLALGAFIAGAAACRPSRVDEEEVRAGVGAGINVVIGIRLVLGVHCLD
jgi:hypothetical protein